jgi:hypothetical protein
VRRENVVVFDKDGSITPSCAPTWLTCNSVATERPDYDHGEALHCADVFWPALAGNVGPERRC